MDITLDSSNSHYLIRSYMPGKIVVNTEVITQNLIITPEKLIYPWNSQDFSVLLDFSAEIILLGTGSTWQIILPEKLILFYEKHIGVEVMDTHAACRTFNVLASEGRKVVAGLII